jgi:acetylornithine deacetylase/succinyl-diaminopimelate desuccinylase-like protein
MAGWQAYLAEHQARFVQELLEFLRIPSVSALPQHAADVQRAAEWAARRLTAAGLENARILPTGGHPVVYGDWLHAPGKATVLIYGHVDTQPADPLELWTTPPFEPAIRDGRVYARGASDNKGNILLAIAAVEALLQTAGALPVNVKFFIEGQEEIGSPQIPAFLAAHRDLFACDMVISTDSTQWAEDQPALWVGNRGLCALQIDVYGPASDLHSGVYGGAVQNPIHALVQVLASMRSPDGRILVEGFYDDVVPLSEADRALIAQVPFDEAAYKAQIGVEELFGEPGYSTYERLWARPTLEINGIWGGFQGEGIKTVLPREAHAKITCRLAANQDPDRVAEAIIAHVEKHRARGAKTVARRLPGSAKPYLMPVDHPGNRAAHAVLEELYGKPPLYVRTGATLPVSAMFLDILGAYTVSFGFGLEDEQFHAPNEFFRLASFERGQRAYCMLLERLGT